MSIFNLELRRKNNFEKRYFDSIAEISENEFKILNEISEYALSSRANQWSIIQSLKYIKNKNINGDIVECGVYKGGSLLLILKILKTPSTKPVRKVFIFKAILDSLFLI